MPKSKLHATAEQWRRQLEAEDLQGFDRVWVEWHFRVAHFAVEVDFVQWLDNGAAAVQKQTSTFRDAATLLPLLDVCRVHLPVSKSPVCLGNLFGGVDSTGVALGLRFSAHFSKARCVADPSILHWDRVAPADNVGDVTGLYCDSLEFDPHAGDRVASYRQLEDPLCTLRLNSDFVRICLRLWGHQFPACIIVPTCACPVTDILSRIAPFRRVVESKLWLASFCFSYSPFCCLTPP